LRQIKVSAARNLHHRIRLGETTMSMISELGSRSDRMFAMANAMGREMSSTLLGGDISPEEVRRGTVRCLLCRHSDRCAELIGASARLDAAPPYCRNQDFLDGLPLNTPTAQT
jgi:hypothetical protein